MRPTFRRAPRLVIALPLALAVSRCSSTPCTEAAPGTLTVKVVDQNVDDPTAFICSATVTLTGTDGGAPLTLTGGGPEASAVNCEYQGNVEPGTYAISVTAPGYVTGTQTETIDQASCVTSSETITVTIAQAAQP